MINNEMTARPAGAETEGRQPGHAASCRDGNLLENLCFKHLPLFVLQADFQTHVAGTVQVENHRRDAVSGPIPA